MLPCVSVCLSVHLVCVCVCVCVTQSKSWQGTYHPEVEHQKKMMKDDVKPLLLYPIIYLITQFFPLINRFGREGEGVVCVGGGRRVVCVGGGRRVVCVGGGRRGGVCRWREKGWCVSVEGEGVVCVGGGRRGGVCRWREKGWCVSVEGEGVVCVGGGRRGGVCRWREKGWCVSVEGEGVVCVGGGRRGGVCRWTEKGWCVSVKGERVVCVSGGRRGGVSVKGEGVSEWICLSSPGSPLLRISNWVNPGNPVAALWVLHVLTVPLGGGLTAHALSRAVSPVLLSGAPPLQVCSWLCATC